MLAGALAWAAQAKTFHVAVSGSDTNPGTQTQPLRTIQRAADLAQPGDVVTVHQGVYRERVNPPRGGSSERQRIVYQAAPSETVELKGSEALTNWVQVQGEVWKATLPNSFFGRFNPYSDVIRGNWFNGKGRQHHTGAVYLNGEWLIEATKLDELLLPAGARPAWLENNPDYLLNVAWLRLGTGSGTAGRIPATGFAAKAGTQNAPCSEGGECLGYIQNGHWVRYEHVDFGPRTENVEIRAASVTAGGRIELRLDGPEGELLGTCSVTGTGDWQSWASFQAPIKPTSGLKTLCLVFKGQRPGALEAPLWFAQVDATNTTFWAQFKGLNPNQQLVEINVRQTVFYPDQPGRNFITVRGFHLRQAATPWAPPTAEQMGLIGPHWSKGWIIESNVISHSVCTGLSLGKYGDAWDNKGESVEGYIGTIRRGLSNGWNSATVGHHLVRYNEISHCEQAGIVGSLGAAFSTITGNAIHDVHVRKLFSGAEMSAIKFHGAVDVVISHNHLYHSFLGVWLDWMGQGARISGNLFDGNDQDLFLEVDHGPMVVDNNLLLSGQNLHSRSRGVAFIHNLFGGGAYVVADGRQVPYLKPHATDIAGYHDLQPGDDHYYNNLFAGRADLRVYDTASGAAAAMAGNVYFKAAIPSGRETNALRLAEVDPALKLVSRADGCYLEMNRDPQWQTARPHPLVTTRLLGKTQITGEAFEQPDGAPIQFTADYFGRRRDKSNPGAGPVEQWKPADGPLRVW